MVSYKNQKTWYLRFKKKIVKVVVKSEIIFIIASF